MRPVSGGVYCRLSVARAGAAYAGRKTSRPSKLRKSFSRSTSRVYANPRSLRNE
jgi:hypothetical protein